MKKLKGMLWLAAIMATAISTNAGIISVNFMSGNVGSQKIYGSSTGVIDQSPGQWVNFDTVASLTASDLSGTGVDATVSKAATSVATLANAAPDFPDGTDSFLALHTAGLRDGTSSTKGDTSVTISDMAAYLAAEGDTSYRIIAYYKSALEGVAADAIELGLVADSALMTDVDPDGKSMSYGDTFVEAGNPESNYIVFSGLTADSTTIYLNRAPVGGRDGMLMGFQIETIPEPATLGMVAAFGGSILFIRRKLMM